jgi:hypothetical protein
MLHDFTASPERDRKIAHEPRAAPAAEQWRPLFQPAEGTYAKAIARAAMMLLAMSFRPDLKSSLIEEVIAAVEMRGGRIDDRCFVKFDLRAVFEEIVEKAMAILSAALRERLPGIADEIDDSFSDRLHTLLAAFAPLFPTVGN